MTDRHRRAPPPAETWTPLEAVVSKDVFKAEVLAWVKWIRVEPKEIHIRPMRRKWGSCSTSGRVTFNTEVLAESAAFRTQVIVEELLHLKVDDEEEGLSGERHGASRRYGGQSARSETGG